MAIGMASILQDRPFELNMLAWAMLGAFSVMAFLTMSGSIARYTKRR
jgi:hypothetical protein